MSAIFHRIHTSTFAQSSCCLIFHLLIYIHPHGLLLLLLPFPPPLSRPCCCACKWLGGRRSERGPKDENEENDPLGRTAVAELTVSYLVASFLELCSSAYDLRGFFFGTRIGCYLSSGIFLLLKIKFDNFAWVCRSICTYLQEIYVFLR